MEETCFQASLVYWGACFPGLLFGVLACRTQLGNQRLDAHDVPLQAQLPGADAHGQADDLGEMQNGQADISSGLG